MSVAATVHALDRSSVDGGAECWRVTVAVDRPTGWAPSGWLAFQAKGDWAHPPLAIGDRVTVPVQVVDGRVVRHLAAGDATVRMIGGVINPDQPLVLTGARDALGRPR